MNICEICKKPHMMISFDSENKIYGSISSHKKCRKLFEKREWIELRISILKNDLADIEYQIYKMQE